MQESWYFDQSIATIEQAFKQFLQEYGRQNEQEASFYMSKLAQIIQESNSKSVTLSINTSHLLETPCIQNLAVQILDKLTLYMPSLQNAARSLLPELNFDVNMFVNIEFENPLTITDLASTRAENIGRFTKLDGTVIRTYMTLPELIRGAFKCQMCGNIIGDVVQHYGYTEPVCMTCKSTSFDLLQDKSVYCNFQKIRLQDDSSGQAHIIDVVLRNEQCGCLKPGDPVSLNGCLIPIPQFKQRKRTNQIAREVQAGFAINGQQPTQINQRMNRQRDDQPSMVQDKSKVPQTLSFGMNFLVNSIEKKAEQIPGEVEIVIEKLKQHQDQFIQSFAPFIFGLTELKTAVLLQLIGGVEKTTQENLSIRSDLNVLLVGDPAVAKSSLLKYASKFSDRGIFTSGKSASVAGLTAAIVQDENGDYGVEAGAILRANGGICCIDEFEKISQADQSALHEVMEQQSVSLSKAGVQATLKAKTPVLAAMNPINGRYDAMRSLRQNINITPAILSRFDLVFVIKDEIDERIDQSIARRILDTADGITQKVSFTENEIKMVLKIAKQNKPIISIEAQNSLRTIWTSLRQSDLQLSGMKNYRITVRQLESLIRLSEAYAKLEFSETVTPQHVIKAQKLLEQTQIKIHSEKEVYAVNENVEPRIEASDDLSGQQVDEERIVEIPSEDIKKLAIIVKYTMMSQGEISFTKETFVELAAINLSFQQYQLSDQEVRRICESVLTRMVEEKSWVNPMDNDPAKYVFTHLSPDV
ncbi:DNA_replication licensing factor MCM6 [Hexamita inflata]|uniref:DNA helicase n=1 Tax=Hexamita inflata TaxID=28002 RepID=A0AA86P2J6_9EUKA|nr:DNA replication licensing factor MCM6 [Hexamita inflata]